jgi:hypothetical protein
VVKCQSKLPKIFQYQLILSICVNFTGRQDKSEFVAKDISYDCLIPHSTIFP